jgi:hypothetical protein
MVRVERPLIKTNVGAKPARRGSHPQQGVMAGVPSIMQGMLVQVAPKPKTEIRMLSETVRADAREGDIGIQLGEIAKANPEVAIGSHPFFDPQHGANTNVVLRARDAQKLAQAKRAVQDMLERVRRAQSNTLTFAPLSRRKQGFESPAPMISRACTERGQFASAFLQIFSKSTVERVTGKAARFADT